MSTIAEHEWRDLQRIVSSVAKDVARKWPNTVEPDDVEQDVMVVLLESPTSARTVLNADPRIQKQMIWKLGHREANKQQVTYEHFSGQYNYSVDEVRMILERDVLIEPVEHLDVAVMDLIDALTQMTWEKSEYVDPLLTRYADGVVPDRESSERKRLNRAVDALTEHMNRAHRNTREAWGGGPGSRTVKSSRGGAGTATVDYQGDLGDGRR